MIPDETTNDVIHETDAPLLLRLWWRFYGGGMYANRGWRYWREGVYMWLGKRLPAGLVFEAMNQVVEFAEQHGYPTHNLIDVQSDWLIEKVK